MSTIRAHAKLMTLFRLHYFCLFINMWSEIYKHYQLLLFLFMIIIFVCHVPPLAGQFKKFISLEWRNKCCVLKTSDSFLVWLMLAMLLHCDYINIHHKVLFPVSLHATNHKKSCQMHECLELWHFWTKRRLYILTCMTLETKWHITLQQIDIIATSEPLSSIWSTFHSWVTSLYVRDSVDVSLIRALAAKLR